MEQLVGKRGKSINDRHSIDSRVLYDSLCQSRFEKEVDKRSVRILELTACVSQHSTDDALSLDCAEHTVAD